MKQLIILIAMFLGFITAFGQVVENQNIQGKGNCEEPDSLCVVYDYGADAIDEKPCFGDATDGMGLRAFSEWVTSKIEYVNPEKDIIGRVDLQFIVKPDGSVDDVRVLRSLDPEFDAEAVRVVSSSPKWKPGKHKGEFVNVSIVFPVVFILK